MLDLPSPNYQRLYVLKYDQVYQTWSRLSDALTANQAPKLNLARTPALWDFDQGTELIFLFSFSLDFDLFSCPVLQMAVKTNERMNVSDTKNPISHIENKTLLS